MPFSVNIMGGSAGSEKTTENAMASAEFCNETKPTLIYFGPLISYEGSRITKMIDEGYFEPITLNHFFTEEEIFLKNINLTDSIFYANHGGNPIQLIGSLPEDKDRLLYELQTKKTIFPRTRATKQNILYVKNSLPPSKNHG